MKRTIIITNHTSWYTRHIKSFVQRLAAQKLGTNALPTLRVIVKYGRKPRPTIYSTFGVGITISMPHQGPIDHFHFCASIAWGLAAAAQYSTKGLNSSAFSHSPQTANIYPWAANLNLQQKPPKAKVKMTSSGKALKGAEAAQKKVDAWEAKLKKAERMLKKWQRKLTYYNKRTIQLHTEWATDLEKTQGISKLDEKS